MRVTVKLFGPERQAAGADSVGVDVNDGATCADVRTKLGEAHAGLGESHTRFAVNQSFVTDDHVLSAGDEVALIGLVSGG